MTKTMRLTTTALLSTALLLLVLGQRPAGVVAATTTGNQYSRIQRRPVFLLSQQQQHLNSHVHDLDETFNWQSVALKLARGGAMDDSDDEEEEDEEDTDDESSDDDQDEQQSTDLTIDKETVDEYISLTSTMLRQTISVLQKAATLAVKAVSKAVSAAAAEEPDEAKLPTLSRVGKALQRVLGAVLDFASYNDDGDNTRTESGNNNPLLEMDDDDDDKALADYGVYLEKAYQIKSATRNSLNDDTKKKKGPCTIHSGSFSDALAAARREARLLLVLIPSQRPKGNAADTAALQAFLSQDVSNMANRKARKNQKTKPKSFYLWSALPGSPEANLAMKRLKVTATATGKAGRRPILAVAYPAQAVDAHGRPQIKPKLLAQHHATPPPSPDMMAAWMNALRKRHAAQYVKMQTDLQELEHWKERKQGYQSSVKTDVQNKAEQARQKAEAAARAQQERERKEQMEQRREELRQALPEEPSADDANAKTISFRSPDGSAPQQQRFAADTTLETVFNWIDVTMEMERETVVLVTLNGRHSFEWKDCQVDDDDDAKTLEDLKLGKMIAFRVSQRQEEEEVEDGKKDEEDDDDDDE